MRLAAPPDIFVELVAFVALATVPVTFAPVIFIKLAPDTAPKEPDHVPVLIVPTVVKLANDVKDVLLDAVMFNAVPPIFKLDAVPVKPVPGPLNCVDAVIVVPETVPTVMLGVPVKLDAVEDVVAVAALPPILKPAAFPVKPVPGPLNCVVAVNVVA